MYTYSGDYGKLGKGTTTDYKQPPDDAISLNADFVPIQIVGGEDHTCSLSIDGRVACWGYVCSLYFVHNTFSHIFGVDQV